MYGGNMAKRIEQLCKEFEKELKLNDELVAKNKKSDIEKSNEFANFIKNNKCKIMGGKNGKN